MTGMLASVRDLREARIALQENVDIIDLKDPGRGVLGAVGTGVAEDVVEAVGGRCLVSATVGDLPMRAEPIAEAVTMMAATGVDVIKIGINGEPDDDVLRVFKEQSMSGVRGTRRFFIVAVLFADIYMDVECLPVLAGTGIRGGMLDTADKSGSLRGCKADELIGHFVRQARSCGFLAGLAGSLTADDVPPLLRLSPDYLGFRGALCRGNVRTSSLDRQAVRRIRALVNADACE